MAVTASASINAVWDGGFIWNSSDAGARLAGRRGDQQLPKRRRRPGSRAGKCRANACEFLDAEMRLVDYFLIEGVCLIQATSFGG
jgi:hypothetical protein